MDHSSIGGEDSARVVSDGRGGGGGGVGEPESARRFANRVDDYVKFRPHYPSLLGDFLLEKVFPRDADGNVLIDAVADIGSGTGISTVVLSNALPRALVHAVEPSDAMRRACAEYLAPLVKEGRVKLACGTSDATCLPDGCVDVVFAGQAFHWFDHGLSRREFRRILRPRTDIGTPVVLFWNIPVQDGSQSEFTSSYLEILRVHGKDYEKVSHFAKIKQHGVAFFEDFLQPGSIETSKMPNPQTYDWEKLLGRVKSTSYMPSEGAEGYSEMKAALSDLFHAHVQKESGTVVLDVFTHVVRGKLLEDD